MRKKYKNSPVLHAVERLLVGDVVHENEPHGAPVIRRRDGPVTFLARRVLYRRRRYYDTNIIYYHDIYVVFQSGGYGIDLRNIYFGNFARKFHHNFNS